MRTSTAILAALGSTCALSLCPIAAHGQSSLLTDLGAVAPATGINNSGQVVLQNYFYSSGTLTALPAGFNGAGINASGQVVGSVEGADSASCLNVSEDQGITCAFGMWANGTLTTYPVFMQDNDDDYGNQAHGINASGQIVGNVVTYHGEGGAILLSGGTFTSLAFPTSTCSGSVANPAGVAWAINDAGQIVGMLPNNASGPCNGDAFLFSGGVYTDIGVGEALALNASAQVVGSLVFAANGPTHAFLYNPASPPAQDLGTLAGGTNSWAYAIDSTGLIVGASDNSAFFFNGVMSDLNTFILSTDPLQPYVTLTDARGINDSGLVVVNGVDSRTNLQHAYLLQVPLVTISPGPLTFPSEAIGSPSPTQSVTFTNAGSVAVALGAPSTTGSGFAMTGNSCGAQLGASGGSCVITIDFTPTAAGTPTGALTLSVGGVPMVVPLSGSSPLSVTLSTSSPTSTAGKPVTLTWGAQPGATCAATGGSAADGWTGNGLPASGTRAVTEATAGTYTYGINCTAGTESGSAQVQVVVSWPAVTASLSASPASIMAGQSVVLTWSAPNATGCTATGGGTDDGWAGSKAASGTQSVTEAFAPTTAVALSFGLSCSSSVSGLSASATARVMLEPTAAAGSGGGSGGGGGLGLLELAVLATLIATRLAAARARIAISESPSR